MFKLCKGEKKILLSVSNPPKCYDVVRMKIAFSGIRQSSSNLSNLCIVLTNSDLWEMSKKNPVFSPVGNALKAL